MRTKKKIRDIIDEHSAELKKGTRGYHSIDKKIWLTNEDYLRVYIFEYEIEIGLHLDNSEVCVFFGDGSINDLDGVWRKFRYRFKRIIVREEEFNYDAEFVAKLKELYCLL